MTHYTWQHVALVAICFAFFIALNVGGEILDGIANIIRAFRKEK